MGRGVAKPLEQSLELIGSTTPPINILTRSNGCVVDPPGTVTTCGHFFRAQDQDSQSKGVEFFRGIYAKADLLIKPRTCLTKLDIAREVLCSCGIEPERCSSMTPFAGPHRVISGPQEGEAKLLARTLIDHAEPHDSSHLSDHNTNSHHSPIRSCPKLCCGSSRTSRKPAIS